MTVLILRCGSQAHELPVPHATANEHRVADLSEVPSRQELKVMDEEAKRILPDDPTPSLDEIAAQPDVRHLGAPGPAPQQVEEPLRVIVVGTDAALSAVLTRAMRADYLWAEIAFIPAGESAAAKNWGLPTDVESAWSVALNAPVRPVPLIRNDAGVAIAGSSLITQWVGDGETTAKHNTGEITGEIIVDDAVLLRASTGDGVYGARLVPMLDAPGIVAARAVGPLWGAVPKPGFFARFRKQPAPGALDAASVLTGRAVQAGGPSLRVVVDGISAKRPVDRVTFYRHLRDLQVVRP